MNEDQIELFGMILGRLSRLEEVIGPTGEPTHVRLVWCNNGGSAVELEIWGVIVAQTFGDPLGELTVAESYTLAQGLNLEYVKELVGHMNEIIKLEES